jgi:hypothetical protein
MGKHLALWLYRCLLAFYPTGFRTEFEAEMKDVFTEALAERRASMVRLLGRELRDWPGVVWHAHHAERSEMMMSTSSSRAQPEPAQPLVPASSWRAAWLAALVHLFYLWIAAGGVVLRALVGPLHLTNRMQDRLTGYGAGAILVIDLIVVLLCWRRGWPRWGLPYLGVVLSVLALFTQAGIRNDGSLLIFIAPLVFLCIFLLAALGRWWKGLHSLYERLNSDWTLFGLAYFSYTPWVFIFMLDETRYQTTGTMLSSVILSLGVLVYMRCTRLGWRSLVLPIAYTAASLATAFYLRVDYFSWQAYYASDSWRSLVNWEVVGIMPLLVFGFLELGRHAVHRWLQAA